MKRLTLTKLRDIDRELLMAARSAMEGAYNPYSNFFVGAAVLQQSRKIQQEAFGVVLDDLFRLDYCGEVDNNERRIHGCMQEAESSDNTSGC